MIVLPEPVAGFVAAQGWGQVIASQLVGGGSINDARRLTTQSGHRLFLKLNRSAPSGMFQREADGLAALAAAPGAPRVPAAYLSSDQFILMEYLPSAPPPADYWPGLGRQLARLHAVTSPRFGFDHDNYIGATPQPNDWTADGFAFFAEHRLGFQANRAHERGLLTLENLRRVERLAGNLTKLVPPQPASLLHGDLWSGNIIPGPDGRACLVDPAAHSGWAEADLAMTALFGRPPDSFYAAYSAERPLVPDYQDRFDLYNLYHLLNHLNLFGSSYLASVEGVLARYA